MERIRKLFSSSLIFLFFTFNHFYLYVEIVEGQNISQYPICIRLVIEQVYKMSLIMCECVQGGCNWF